MRILVDIGHPAHVHFFKNFIREMDKRGHKIIVTARDKDVALPLLRGYGIEHVVVGRASKGKLHLIREWIGRDREIYALAGRFRPDILIGVHNPCVAHVSRFTGARSIIFTDTEHARIASLVTFPLADVICTPSCFQKDLGKKQVRYSGYHELAYLHPNHFKPDPAVLSQVGLSEGEKYAVLRFVSWKALHDIGQHGMRNGKELTGQLEKYVRVLISAETELPEELKKYRINISPDRLHDLLYYASLYVGDGATMAVESAVLGTPALYVSSLAGRMGNLVELEQKYGLLFSYSDGAQVVSRAVDLMRMPELKETWQRRRQRVLQEKGDASGFMVRFVEDYAKGIEK